MKYSLFVTIITVCSFIFSPRLVAQTNLCPNPSFEDHIVVNTNLPQAPYPIGSDRDWNQGQFDNIAIINGVIQPVPNYGSHTDPDGITTHSVGMGYPWYNPSDRTGCSSSTFSSAPCGSPDLCIRGDELANSLYNIDNWYRIPYDARDHQGGIETYVDNGKAYAALRNNRVDDTEYVSVDLTRNGLVTGLQEGDYHVSFRVNAMMFGITGDEEQYKKIEIGAYFTTSKMHQTTADQIDVTGTEQYLISNNPDINPEGLLTPVDSDGSNKENWIDVDGLLTVPASQTFTDMTVGRFMDYVSGQTYGIHSKLLVDDFVIYDIEDYGYDCQTEIEKLEYEITENCCINFKIGAGKDDLDKVLATHLWFFEEGETSLDKEHIVIKLALKHINKDDPDGYDFCSAGELLEQEGYDVYLAREYMDKDENENDVYILYENCKLTIDMTCGCEDEPDININNIYNIFNPYNASESMALCGAWVNPNCNYVLTGNTWGNHSYILNTDIKGEVLWARVSKYIHQRTVFNFIHKSLPLYSPVSDNIEDGIADYGLIHVGEITGPNFMWRPQIILIDKDGNNIKNYVIDRYPNKSSHDRMTRVIQNDELDYIAMGSNTTFNDLNYNNQRIYLIKVANDTDPQQIEPTEYILFGNPNYDFIPNSIVQLQNNPDDEINGSYVIVGETTTKEGFIVVLNPDFTKKDAYLYDQINMENKELKFTHIFEDEEGKVIVSGNHESIIYSGSFSGYTDGFMAELNISTLELENLISVQIDGNRENSIDGVSSLNTNNYLALFNTKPGPNNSLSSNSVIEFHNPTLNPASVSHKIDSDGYTAEADNFATAYENEDYYIYARSYREYPLTMLSEINLLSSSIVSMDCKETSQIQLANPQINKTLLTLNFTETVALGSDVKKDKLYVKDASVNMRYACDDIRPTCDCDFSIFVNKVYNSSNPNAVTCEYELSIDIDPLQNCITGYSIDAGSIVGITNFPPTYTPASGQSQATFKFYDINGNKVCEKQINFYCDCEDEIDITFKDAGDDLSCCKTVELSIDCGFNFYQAEVNQYDIIGGTKTNLADEVVTDVTFLKFAQVVCYDEVTGEINLEIIFKDENGNILATKYFQDDLDGECTSCCDITPVFTLKSNINGECCFDVSFDQDPQDPNSPCNNIRKIEMYYKDENDLWSTEPVSRIKSGGSFVFGDGVIPGDVVFTDSHLGEIPCQGFEAGEYLFKFYSTDGSYMCSEKFEYTCENKCDDIIDLRVEQVGAEPNGGCCFEIIFDLDVNSDIATIDVILDIPDDQQLSFNGISLTQGIENNIGSGDELPCVGLHLDGGDNIHLVFRNAQGEIICTKDLRLDCDDCCEQIDIDIDPLTSIDCCVHFTLNLPENHCFDSWVLSHTYDGFIGIYSLDGTQVTINGGFCSTVQGWQELIFDFFNGSDLLCQKRVSFFCSEPGGKEGLFIGIDPIGSSIYNVPNPAGASTEIHFDLDVNGEIVFELYDLLGQSLGKVHVEDYEIGHHSFELTTESYPAGTYLLRYSINGITGSHKFQVE